MAETCRAQLNKANPNTNAPNFQIARVGDALHELPYTETLAAAANIATPTYPARAILACCATVGGAPGWKLPALHEAVPAAGSCAVNPDGSILFAGADAVTACEITYVPVEGDIVTEEIPVTAAGVGTFLNGHCAEVLLAVTLNAPAATPGVKTFNVARGTAAPGAGTCCIDFPGTGMQFTAAECGAVCTATVQYYARPGQGTAVNDTVGARIDTAVPTP